MDKAKILRLLDEADDIVSALYRQGANKNYKCKSLREKLKVIETEITAPAKSNADRIRQMADEELAKIMRSCKFCAYLDKGCQHNGTCTQGFLEWLKQEVQDNE